MKQLFVDPPGVSSPHYFFLALYRYYLYRWVETRLVGNQPHFSENVVVLTLFLFTLSPVQTGFRRLGACSV